MGILSIFQRGADGPAIERVRHGVWVMDLRVARVVSVTPGVLRVTLTGHDLVDFRSLAFDDHVKIFVPTPQGAVERRDYTPRRYDGTTGELDLDFALHDGGPATAWAMFAQPGDELQVRAPKGSAVLPQSVRSWVLIGDETALPAIGRRIEEAASDERILAIVAVENEGERQRFETTAHLDVRWAYRPKRDADDPSALLAKLASSPIPEGAFVWIAAEAGVARRLRDHVLDERRHPRAWLKAGGYWVWGRADAHQRIG